MIHNQEDFASVRSFLATKTAQQHQALHDHPLFSKLVTDDLSAPEYMACLAAHFQAFQGIETARTTLDTHPAFSLSEQLAALASDLSGQDEAPDPAVDLSLDTSQEVLGALYVAHGSQFGRTVIGRALQANLPNAPRTYFSLPPEKLGWRAFLNTMETIADEEAHGLLDGAQRAFVLMHDEADKALARVEGHVSA